jgi:hypothetical protein
MGSFLFLWGRRILRYYLAGILALSALISIAFVIEPPDDEPATRWAFAGIALAYGVIAVILFLYGKARKIDIDRWIDTRQDRLTNIATSIVQGVVQGVIVGAVLAYLNLS